ncbi:type IV secretory system conjugative DNA transfer family protein [Niastella populi]|uniref:Type IV secretion system coupling protein TraD DNA-binding domain-containing protein n=1 Tax=Niastella populi TaxID=550983 RepID=A0A1V9GAT6_9BACT|nr:type IV secretion system DNA-binding domain-containing protein [Niastella populi]OQP67690.1 hypothetical protein A4R26_11545 [Niastella populi]
MLYTRSQYLTDQFRAWDERGRGWHVFPVPVDPEPAFVPFIFSEASNAIIDDGKRPGLVGGIFGELKKMFAPPKEEDPAEEDTIQAFPFEEEYPLRFFSLSFPKGQKVPQFETEQFIIMLAACSYPISFELIATAGAIQVQFVCANDDAAYLQGQMQIYFPGCSLIEYEDSLFGIFVESVQAYELGLRQEFMLPLAMPNSLDFDPHGSLFGILEQMPEGKRAAVQVVFQGCRNPWAESIVRSVHAGNGKPFFEDAPEMVAGAKQKISAPLFASIIRVMASAKDAESAGKLAWAVGDALVRQSKSANNSLMLLSNDEYEYADHLGDLLYRRTRRLGMIVNSKELANFVHYPSVSIPSQKLVRDTRKTKAVPGIATGVGLLLGKNKHQGKEATVSIPIAPRLRHMHLIGATGTGKSTLLLNMIVQDIRNNTGLCVLDPHGDLVEKILPYIPERRKKDVLIIDPADAEHPVGFNILTAHSDIEKDILASDLVAAFKRLSTSWGDQMNSVFANAVLAFLESSQGGTLADLRRFLVEKGYRDSILRTVADPSVLYYWKHEYPLLKTSSIGSILTRLDSFLRPKLIRNMVCQHKGIDFSSMMDEGKIILVKLSQGLIGSENSYLLGTFITAKIQQAAMARQAQAQETRRDFFLYVDEFQHFITPSMSSILSGTRKYHLGLILAHQSMAQVSDSELASAILANAGTRICFRLGETDARKLEDGFSFFDTKDLQNLGTGEAIARIEKPDFDFSLNTVPLEKSDVPGEVQEQIIECSRKAYGTPKGEVEEMLAESMRTKASEEPKQKRKEQSAEPKEEDYIPFEEVVPEKEASQEQAKEERQAKTPITIRALPEPAPIRTTTDPKEVTDTPEAQEFLQTAEVRLHTSLQNRIKRMAEDDRGYKATIEALTPDGKGFVDVLLERDGKTIAVEISVTTKANWELHNVMKCLDAGYGTIIVCTQHKRNIEKIRSAINGVLPPEKRTNVFVFEPDALFAYLDEHMPKTELKERRVGGYKVKAKYRTTTEKETQQKREEVAKVIIDSLRKKKK